MKELGSLMALFSWESV